MKKCRDLDLIENTIKEIIMKELQDPTIEIAHNTDLAYDLGLDSIRWIMILLKIEETFTIELPTEMLIIESVTKFSCLVDLVQQVVVKEGEQY